MWGRGAEGVAASPTEAGSRRLGCCPWQRPLVAVLVAANPAPPSLACGAGTDAGIGGAVYGAAQDVLREADVVGDNCSTGKK